MQMIPVIDLKDGLVVHAVRGDRDHYQPIHRHSVLTHSSDIHAVMAGFLAVHPFKRFYIADLNAICGSGHHNEFIQNVTDTHPDIEFWLDNAGQFADIKNDQPNLKWVIGTESQRTPPYAANQEYILSLDFKNDRQAGLASWFSQTECWPKNIIVMTLNRVGSNQGPDLEKLSDLQQRHPYSQFIAAGGVRNLGDLLTLKTIGALHSGAISKRDIQNL